MVWIECTLSEFAYNIKWGGSADLLEGRKALQRGLHRLECSAESSCMKFIQEKCQFCTWLTTPPHNSTGLGQSGWKAACWGSTLRVRIDRWLSMSQQLCADDQEGQYHPVWYQKERGQQDQGSDGPPVLGTAEVNLKQRVSVLGPSLQEKR